MLFFEHYSVLACTFVPVKASSMSSSRAVVSVSLLVVSVDEIDVDGIDPRHTHVCMHD